MSDKEDVRRKLGLVSAHPAKTAPMATEPEDECESRCFGFLRGIRDRSLVLEFRRIKEGDAIAFPYSWLGPSHFHPSTGIAIVFSGGELFGVRIRGRNLNAMLDGGLSLYERGVLRHRVTFIRETPALEARGSGTGECVVERIEVHPLQSSEMMRFLGAGE